MCALLVAITHRPPLVGPPLAIEHSLSPAPRCLEQSVTARRYVCTRPHCGLPVYRSRLKTHFLIGAVPVTCSSPVYSARPRSDNDISDTNRLLCCIIHWPAICEHAVKRDI